MNALVKKTIVGTTIILSSLSFTVPAFAAAPDGNGPWADSVLSSSQGTMKNGGAVPAPRSNPNAAVGVAEDNTTETNFFSLGFGGNIALGFDNGISSGVIIVEATNVGYPTETAKVEVSENGTTWVLAGNVSQDGQVAKPQGLGCAKYVRVTDTSDPNNFPDATADAYDVDGVQATGEPCQPPPPGGGDCCDCGCTNITQVNNSFVSTGITTKAKTGNNKANNNTGTGSATINTGNATNTVNVTVTGNTNTSNGGTGCCCNGTNNINISGNGPGSVNKVIIGKKPLATPSTFRFGR